MTARRALVPAALLAALTACHAPAAPSPVASVPASGIPSGVRHWQRTVDTTVEAAPVVAGPLVIVAGAGKAYGLDIQTGAIRWQTPIPGTATADVTDGKAVYVTLDQGRLISLDAATGHVRWRAPGRVAVGRPVAAASGVYAFAPDKSLVALDADSGKVVWRKTFPGGQSQRVTASGTSVYIGDSRGFVSAYRGSSGQRIWRVPASLAPIALIASDDDAVYACFPDEEAAHALSTRDGHRLWRDTGIDCGSDLKVSAGLVVDSSSSLIVWDRRTGRRMAEELGTWAVQAAAADATHIYIRDGSGILQAVDAPSGVVVWSVPTEWAPNQPDFTVADGVVFDVAGATVAAYARR